jgi:hypothetical protein
MTNFDVIADRIIDAEGVSFAIACTVQPMDEYTNVAARREALKQAIVEALEDVLISATGAMKDHNA